MDTSQTRTGADQTSELVSLYGFVPNLFRMQSEVPRVVEAEIQLLNTASGSQQALSRAQKEGLIAAVAAVRHNEYCERLYRDVLTASDEKQRCLLSFCLKLAAHAPWFSRADVEDLIQCGFDEAAVLEAIAATATGQMLCTLVNGLQPDCDYGTVVPSTKLSLPPVPSSWEQIPGPYLKTRAEPSPGFHPWQRLQDEFGFVPNLFRAQMILPDLVKAEVQLLEGILFAEESLTRVQKEIIVLMISATNLNTYGVAVHGQVIGALGIPPEECDRILEGPNDSNLSPAEKALLQQIRKLALPYGRSRKKFEWEELQREGFTRQQIIEAVATAALANFLNTLQFGIGAVPEFPPRRIFSPKDLYLSLEQFRPTSNAPVVEDPDAVLVVRVQNGDVDTFEELIRKHTPRVFRTLASMIGNPEDARDLTQDVFLRAYENIRSFQGRSKFSTWMLSIAINTGTEFMRRRKPVEPLENEDDSESFRPRQVQSWSENPEQLYSAAERSQLVREGVLRLPEKYRTALILRDINQLSSEEAAAALDISLQALKARVLRARLMLRERLAPYFTQDPREDTSA